MKYDDENWIKIYTRDSAGWLALSWQARGVSLELARKLPKGTGELSLGRRGLEALGALLRAPWSEIEPAVRELIADGRLIYDDTAQVIRDPKHTARQTAVASGKSRTATWRAARDAARRLVTDGDAPPSGGDAPPTTTTRKKTPAERRALSVVESADTVAEKTNDSVVGVTLRDACVTTRDQEKRIEEKEERPPIGGLKRADAPPPEVGSLRLLAPDEPLTAQRRKDFAGQTSNVPARPVEPEWAAFVDDRIKRSATFGSDAAIDADWRNWVRRENRITAERRQNSQGRGKADTRQPMRDPNPEWLRRASNGDDL